ncbi:MAG: UvrD-helicase domain-containing protein [Paludibacteraceae bacterium]|nr:UvrD-helicase domain-containing protein [Paludibacteraceae bacterium]
MKTTASELLPMTVYKASAGSGKTFTLAAQYISIVLYDAWKYNNYRSFENIVAMTFTVKATKEMKDRILSYLYDLGQGRQDQSFIGFKTKLGELLRLKDDSIDIMAPGAQNKLQTCAREILSAILRNYARFNVTTIDSFFQSVLQGVLYELGLPAEQQLLLDETDIHNQSVDRMIDSLHDDQKSMAVLNPILDFAKDSLNDNKSVWDIRKELKSEAEKLGQEVYKFQAEAIEEESRGGRYDTLRKTLYAKKAQIARHIEEACDGFLQKASAYPLSGKKPVSVLVTAAVNMRGLKWDGPNQTVQKVLNGELSGDSVYDDFTALYNTYMQCLPLLNTLTIVLPNLYTITLLANIESNMKDIQRENMQMLLSNANLFLRDLLAGDARGFVYSKTGPKLNHLLIDEFQDTSQMQWDNLQPLVEELNSNGKHCVIVGDIKQSIYRFRNGKWKLLADIAGNCGSVSLGDNFRSTRAVVQTNNELFPLLAQEMDRILDANGYGTDYLSPVYDKEEVRQNVKKEGGNVRFYLYPRKTGEAKEAEEERLRQDFCGQFKAVRQGLAANNESASIAILVRTRDDGDRVLEWMQQDEDLKNLSVETEDSYQLASSPTLQLLVAMLKYIAAEDMDTRQHSVERQYIEDRLGQEALDELENSRTHWLSHPLYEMSDRLIRHFGLTRMHEDEFIEKYLSCLKAWLTANTSTTSGLTALLAFWDETMSKVKVNKTPEKDSVTLMTIHKSKGLAFDYVFVPLFNSTMNKEYKTTLLWDTRTVAQDTGGYGICQDLQSVSVLSVTSLKSRTSQSLWSAPYSEEVRLRFMDAINTVYVAFTRAKQAYCCWCAYSMSPKTTDTDSIGTPLLKALGSISGLGREELTEDVIVFTGECAQPEQTAAKAEKETAVSRLDITKNAGQNPIITPMFPDTRTLPVEIVNSNRALRLFRDIQADTADIQEQKSFIDDGLIYHALFENLATLSPEHVRQSVDLYRLTHELDERHEQAFRQFVQEAQTSDILREAFSPAARILAEATFIVTTPDGVETVRPDRVAFFGDRALVIDYKFSFYRHLMLDDERHALQRRQYFDQLTGYIGMIQRFYQVPAEGWLWFLRDNRVINVKSLN